MVLYSLSICRKNNNDTVTILASAHELSKINYFFRSNALEICTFCNREFVKKTKLGYRHTIDYEGYSCHIYVRFDGIAAVAITDEDYADLSAHTLVSKVLCEFDNHHMNPKLFPEILKDNCFTDKCNFLGKFISDFQNPKETDKIQLINYQLDMTSQILRSNIDLLLDRGQKLNDLISQSEDLCTASKKFARESRKLNSWCCWLL